MAENFSLKDHLFNADTIGQLADEFACVDGFDPDRFAQKALDGFASRELLARLDWIADCIEEQLADDFPTMVNQLRRAMPPALDPEKSDDDFGQFIHAVPGILAVRHGLEDHRDLALDLIEQATQRFSMEFYIRPFLNRWPAETLSRLKDWALHSNYHVRRLVSEGTRPRLPWAANITLDINDPIPLLDQLHADPTRYVTRSVANHLNDISKKNPAAVLKLLASWSSKNQQEPKELAWMTKHALRSLIKQGHEGAMKMLGYHPDAAIKVCVFTCSANVKAGDSAQVTLSLSADKETPVLIDYIIHFRKANGSTAAKVFKWKQTTIPAGTALKLTKSHRFKADATTFKLHSGQHRIELQVNGRVIAGQDFVLE